MTNGFTGDYNAILMTQTKFSEPFKCLTQATCFFQKCSVHSIIKTPFEVINAVGELV